MEVKRQVCWVAWMCDAHTGVVHGVKAVLVWQ